MKGGNNKGYHMKTKLIYPMVVVVFAAACGGDGDSAGRTGQRQYESVQEGSAAGVTSTINGPGETLPPITNTNADTTTSFAFDPNAVPAGSPQQQPATMAGTLPPTGGSSPSYYPSPSPSPRPAYSSPSPQPQRQAYVPPPMTSSSQPRAQQPAPQQQTEPRETQPAEEPAAGPAPTSDSANTTAPPPATNTAPAPSAQPKPQEQPQQQEEPAENNDQEQEEAPPPPPPAFGVR
jgi:hypothetical protein